MNDDDIRVDDLWFSNDMLVIRAEKRIFRVSKSVLAARSSVFSDMIAFPQPVATEAEGNIDGSPVVTLQDSGQDVEVFLRAIFDSSYFMPPPKAVELNVALGILRLAHKYDVRYLFLRALEHLSVRYGPSSLEEYLSPKIEDHLIYDSDKHLRYFSIISAATEVGALWLLPIPYYLASKYTRATLRSKIQLGAQERAVETCLVAQVELLRATVKLTHIFPLPPDPDCKNRNSCDVARNMYNAMFLRALREHSSLTPLNVWISPEKSLCHRCAPQAKTRHAEVLQEVWEDLPGMFDLPSWEELKVTKAAIMGEAD
ncbi:hypothetical protein B0H19DRAFT_1004054 [Mycena capillaripes]|nr:hypothetical protein B0H19DRAFT_1004054 [Mycena capillaripes]